jgi:hypothetical protein
MRRPSVDERHGFVYDMNRGTQAATAGGTSKRDRPGSGDACRAGALGASRGRPRDHLAGGDPASPERARPPGARRHELGRIADAIERLVGHLVPSQATEVPVTEYVTQKNCMQVVGLTARRFLELLRRDDAPPVIAVGKVRMVRRDQLLAFLDRLRRVTEPVVEADGAAEVLAEIGCVTTRRGG